MRAAKYVNGRSATLAYRLSGTAAHRLAEAWLSRFEQWSPAVRQNRRFLAAGELEPMLESLARLETTGRAASIDVARWLEASLEEASGRRVLSEAAERVLRNRPDSHILLYLRLLGLCDELRFDEAHRLISAALCRLCDEMGAGRLGATRGHERAEALIGLWKIADSAARDQMRWITDSPELGAAYAKFDFIRAFEAIPADPRWSHHLTTLAFAEPLLQGKQNDAYLARCRLAFSQAGSLFQRLHVVRAACRQGLRRIPDYDPAYRTARELFGLCRPEMESAMAQRGKRPMKDPRAYVRWLRAAHSLAAQLGETGDAARMAAELIECARGAVGDDARWMAASALAQEREHSELLSGLVGSLKPGREQDLRDFYQVLAQTGDYDRAHALFETLPAAGRARQASLIYANILQRSHRFDEAERLVREVHANLLANVDILNHFVSYGLIRRAAELGFAAETARHYEAVPQPGSPKGVILVSPRTIEQLRRTPLVVLMEWKRMGWAVVPIYEGILPLQKTGIEEIDRLAGSIRTVNDLRPDARGWMKSIEPIDVDYDARHLSWREIDLSHAMWEEAAINRRVYNVTWTCPALRRSLANLVGWTESTIRVLETAREDFGRLGLRTGVHMFLNFRLPDAVVRFYCEQHGDPRDFFCIHASNGYENYFINFERNVSTRMTIRNMTAHPGVRTSSMPLAEDVLKVTATDRGGVERSLADLLATSRLRPNAGEADAARGQALQRIDAWRKGGGFVACAFGRVVCDSGVPYDGGPCHRSMLEWILDTIEAAKDSRTLLLIKPHPHEMREEIACFLNETFRDLLPAQLPDNVIYLGHDWFETHQLKDLIDLALIYNGTTAVEMALLDIPAVVSGHFAPIDYPLEQTAPADRDDYHRLVRFERRVATSHEGQLRAAAWLSLMRSDNVSVPYRYHSRQITNRVVYPPYWFGDEIETYLHQGDANVRMLAERGVDCEQPARHSGLDQAGWDDGKKHRSGAPQRRVL